MLYEEFLIGTEKPDNEWTYAEYKRIEAIYNNDNSMEKSDAYKMYQEPNDLIKALLDKISDYKAEMICAKAENRSLKSQVERLERVAKAKQAQIDEIERIINDIPKRVEAVFYD